MTTKKTIPHNFIINADDYGLNSRVNQAIIKSFKCGLINSASIMVNMPGFQEAITLWKKRDFKGNIGLHTCLTEGKPITNLWNTPFIDENGFFVKSQFHKPAHFLKLTNRKKVKAEIIAQIEKLLIEDVHPNHINSHHTIHELPWLLPIFLSISRKYNVKIRICQTWSSGNNFIKSTYRFLANIVYKTYGSNFTNYFEIIKTSTNRIQSENRNIEIMVHPDLNEEGKIIDSYDGLNLEERIPEMLNYHKIN